MRLIIEINQEIARLDYLNFATIALIHEKNTAKCVTNYKPISLLNWTIKIISKIWANRLAPKLPELVGEYQMGFIKGRIILNGIVVIHEIIHQVKKENKKILLLKLDFEKAYYRVN